MIWLMDGLLTHKMVAFRVYNGNQKLWVNQDGNLWGGCWYGIKYKWQINQIKDNALTQLAMDKGCGGMTLIEDLEFEKSNFT
jgi:hypothetical protein